MMGIKVSWLNREENIALVEFGSSYTVEELTLAADRVRRLLDNTTEMIDVVIDLSNCSEAAPRTMTALPHIADRTEHVRLGRVYVIGATGFMRTIVDIYSNVFRPLLIVPSRDEAVKQARRPAAQH